jgi:LPS export ABC transporter protein LptC
MLKKGISQLLQHAGNGVMTLFLACCLAACGNDIEKTRIFESHTLPDSTITNAHIRRSENGRLQLLMTAPLVRQYSNPESKTEYPKGVHMRFFDGYNNPTGKLTARYAVQYDKRQITMVRDSVVIIDLRNGDTIYLQDLTWNQAEHRVFSDKPLRSKNGDRITLGDRFESDDEFREPRIFHQRGTLEWKEE